MRISDWSSDVCSSDLPRLPPFTQITRTCSSQAVAASTDSAANRQFPCPPLSERETRNARSGRSLYEEQATHHNFAKRSHPGCRRSEEHTSELQSLMRNSYAVFCLKKQTTPKK